MRLPRTEGESLEPIAPVHRKEVLASLPPEADASGLRLAARASLEAARACIAVLDDDPTGGQTVHGVWELTRWGAEELRQAMAELHTGSFIKHR
jgi:hypothetical protein